VNVQAGVGYRNDVTTGVAVGRQPQGAFSPCTGSGPWVQADLENGLYPSAATERAVQANVVAVGYHQVSSGFPVPGTAYTITNVNSGTAAQPANCATTNGTGIVAEDCETANGTTVRQWAQLDNTCQQWSITP
jgi:hypothetical protein